MMHSIANESNRFARFSNFIPGLIMYAITGISGKVGGALARTLLSKNLPVRAIVRDANKAHDWTSQGCESVLADMEDVAALTAAFSGAEGVFILPPSNFDPSPGFPEARVVIDAVKAALEAARPRKVVCLSTIGAQASQSNLLTQRSLMEHALSQLSIPVTFLRPGWFMENSAWDVASARDEGIVQSFLQPLDKRVPMIATADVGRVAAELLQQVWTGTRLVELEAPHRVSPNDIAAAFAKILGRDVRAEIVPRETWDALFRSQGMNDPMPRIQMLDGFNEGWIEFEGAAVKGEVELETVLRQLVERAGR
jgi:NAD(P)H dehydrogenase (quinone)